MQLAIVWPQLARRGLFYVVLGCLDAAYLFKDANINPVKELLLGNSSWEVKTENTTQSRKIVKSDPKRCK